MAENVEDRASSSPFDSPFSSRPTSPNETVQELPGTEVASAENCDPVLETIDSFVACVEGVDVQDQYEQRLTRHEEAIENHGLSNDETALIRLQIMEEQKKRKGEDATSSFAIPDSLDLNLCGNDDDEDEKVSHFPSTQGVTTENAPVSSELLSDGDENQNGITSPTSSGLASVPSTALTCAICFDGDGDESPSTSRSSMTFAYLPCCGSNGREETSTTKVCTACILLLSSPTSDGSERVGRCPRCRSWIAVTTEEGTVTIRPLETAGTCSICYQLKTVLVENEQVCDACFLGRQRPLLYECEQCSGVQRIPHPMYRYQPTVSQFGRTTWACNQHCMTFTNWRIVPDQVRFIATGDIPVEWGEDYLFLDVARARVREARLGIAENTSSNTHNDDQSGGWNCVVQ